MLGSPHDTFQSPFTVRYGSDPMRSIWSERTKRLTWRKVWLALAESQQELGLVSGEQVRDLRAHATDVTDASITRALEIESEIHHDLMAEVHAYAEQCGPAGGIIHLGATSMDIEDNADALRLRAALAIIEQKLSALVLALADRTTHNAHLACMAFTHLQPAEPTTVGYRLAQHLQDAVDDLQGIRRVLNSVKGKGFKGAVGTSASYRELVPGASGLEQRILDRLNLPVYEVATQTYPRKQDWHVVVALAAVAQTLYKFAFDVRMLQSPPIGEWAEPFGAKQVGSSAMPFKRNPIHSEAIDSLARHMAALPRIMWDNAAHSLLERTLDDSANRRIVLPEAFLCADEIITRATRIVVGLRINEPQIARNMHTYGPFAATERLLMGLARAGANRQNMHEVIREHSMDAWRVISSGNPNPLLTALASDQRILQHVSAADVHNLMDAGSYVGDAPERALAMATRARSIVVAENN